MMPVIGVWNAADATGTLPTIASTPAAFNSTVTGMTTLATQTTQPQQLRIAIADQRGDGRPDFNYQARILYADTVSPATVPSIGGTITITGIGFRPGNIVTINGLPATVTSITSNTITATAPSLHSTTALTADVTVRDLTTGGTTTMTAALNYAALQPTLLVLSSPSGQIFTNQPASPALTIKAISGDGTTPLPNTAITLTSTASVLFNACAASTCTLITDTSGIVITTVTSLAPGPITLTASSTIGVVTAAFNAITRVQTITTSLPTLYLAAGASFQWTADATLSDNAAATIGLPIQWQPLFGPILITPAVSATDASSTARATVTVSPLTVNPQATARACAWSPAICTNLAVLAVDPSQWQFDLLTGDGQSINATDTFAPLTLRIHDSAGHPIAAAPVAIHQTAEPWVTIPCPDQGRCPTAPIYNTSTTTLTSAIDGTVTIPALDLPNQPEITRIAAATGTQGFLSLTLQKHP